MSKRYLVSVPDNLAQELGIQNASDIRDRLQELKERRILGGSSLEELARKLREIAAS